MNKYEVLGVVGEDDEIVHKTTLREVKILRLLRHENIVDLREAFKRKGKLFLVFEYVERNLLEILDEKPNGLESELVRKYIYQLCLSIDFCHRHDVIHRDIKPENLLINSDHSLKLCDFGFARTVNSKTKAELTDYVATRWYRAPELLLGDTAYGKAVDIWAIGCIMGELIDGQPLFPGESEIDQLYVIQKVMGPLTPDQNEMFLHNPRFLGLKFPDMSRPETLEKRYCGKMTKKALSFMKGLLRMDPSQRLTGEEALDHPYFDGMKEELDGPSHSRERVPSAHSDRLNRQQVVPPTQQQQQQQQQSTSSSNSSSSSQQQQQLRKGTPSYEQQQQQAPPTPSKNNTSTSNSSFNNTTTTASNKTTTSSSNNNNNNNNNTRYSNRSPPITPPLGTNNRSQQQQEDFRPKSFTMAKLPPQQDGVRHSTSSGGLIDIPRSTSPESMESSGTRRSQNNNNEKKSGRKNSPNMMEMRPGPPELRDRDQPSTTGGTRRDTNKVHVIKDPKRQSLDGRSMTMEVLIDLKSPRNSTSSSGLNNNNNSSSSSNNNSSSTTTTTASFQPKKSQNAKSQPLSSSSQQQQQQSSSKQNSKTTSSSSSSSTTSGLRESKSGHGASVKYHHNVFVKYTSPPNDDGDGEPSNGHLPQIGSTVMGIHSMDDQLPSIMKGNNNSNSNNMDADVNEYFGKASIPHGLKKAMDSSQSYGSSAYSGGNRWDAPPSRKGKQDYGMR